MRFKGKYWFHFSIKALRARKTIVMTENPKTSRERLGPAIAEVASTVLS